MFLYVFFVVILFKQEFFFFNYSKLGTHGSPRRRGAGHEPPVKNLGLGEVKRFVVGMHNTDNVSGEHHITINKKKEKTTINIIIFLLF